MPRSVPFNTPSAVVLATAVERLAELQQQVPANTPVADYPKLVSSETLANLHALKARLAAFLPTTPPPPSKSTQQFLLTAYDAEAYDLSEEVFTGTFDEALKKADTLAASDSNTAEVAVTTTLNYNKDR